MSNQKMSSNSENSIEIRRIGPEQIENVTKLVTESTDYLFGNRTACEILTHSFLSLGLFDETNTLQACVCLSHCLNLSPVLPSECICWVENLYGLDFLTSFNAYWIHYAVYNEKYAENFLKLILQKFIEHYNMVEYIVMLLPPNIEDLQFIEQLGERIVPKNCENATKVFNLLLISSEALMFKYTIRRAVNEDNDDLIHLLPKQLFDNYGDNYISELLTIDHHENKREILIVEYKHELISCLITNSIVDWDWLNDKYELSVFNDLRRPQVQYISETEYLTRHSDQQMIASEYCPDLPSFSSFSFLLTKRPPDSVVQTYDPFSVVSLLGFKIIDQESEAESQLTSMPILFSQNNVFQIESLALLTKYNSSIYYLLQTIFQCYPDFDYAAILVDNTKKIVPNYILKHFTKVTPRFLSKFSHNLYVLHKSSILNEMSVCLADISDRQEIFEILNENFNNDKQLESLISTILDDLNDDYMIFFMMCNNDTIIGLTIIIEEDNLDDLKTNYNLSNWLVSDKNPYGYLKLFLLSANYHNHGQFFLRELHRLTTYDHLFFSTTYDNCQNCLINNIIDYMMPILPIQQQQQQNNINGNDLNIGDLYLSTLPITSLPQIQINQRILVVGFGNIVVAFLKALMFENQPKSLIIFNNLTLISPYSIDNPENYSNPIRDILLMNNSNNSNNNNNNNDNGYHLKSLINIVYGTITTIERNSRYIITNNNDCLSYDLLILLYNEKFQKPINHIKTHNNNNNDDYYDDDLPENIFIINTVNDATIALEKLYDFKITIDTCEEAHVIKNKPILVYGHYLEAICCIAALLEFGIPGRNIIFVDPGPEQFQNGDSPKYLHSDEIELAILTEMIDNGIMIYQNYTFLDWFINYDLNIVTTVKFEGEFKQLEFEILFIFLYYKKTIDKNILRTINNSGLLFNGQLIIDKNNRTNDKRIYAAGNLTKYSKRYNCNHLNHCYYNDQEIGTQFGKQIRRQLIPTEFLSNDDNNQNMPRKPIILSCKLPGGLNYLTVEKAGARLPLKNGKLLVTGSCDDLSSQGYFLLCLNRFNTVETIVCLSKEEFSVDNLISLYGLHEQYLNKLLQRYENGEINDFFDYFSQPWCCMIYHEDFPKLIEDFKEILEKIPSIIDPNDYDELECFCKRKGFFDDIQRRLFEYFVQIFKPVPKY